MNEMTFETMPLVAPQSKTIGEALAGVLQDPAQLVRHWNYKGAIMSGGLRAPIFLITYLVGHESVKLALGAAAAQFAFRFVFAGVGGALIQAFRKVEPAWKALLTILLIVPVISHVFEFFVQTAFTYFTQTEDHTNVAIVRSICISVLSALFSLFIMRRGVMIVGEAESKSIWSDIARFPVLIFDFAMFIPFEIVRMARRGEYIRALGSGVAGCLFVELMGWAITSKPYWTHNKGQMTFASYYAVDGLIFLVFAVALATFLLRRDSRKSLESA